MWTKVLSLLLLIHLCGSVMVKVGDSSFTLESVKKFIEIRKGGSTEALKQDSDDMKSYAEICNNERLPDEIKTVCGKNSNAIYEMFHGFDLVADEMDVCEVCAFAACTGC